MVSAWKKRKTEVQGSFLRIDSNDRVVLSSRVVFLFLALLFSRNACGQVIEITGQTMGPIEYRVVIGEDQHQINQLKATQLVNSKLSQVNQLMSTYLEDSDVSRFNRTDSTDWFAVDPLTAQVAQRSIEISQLTDGAFDITVGPAVDLWNFGANKHAGVIPTDQQIADVKSIVGYRMLAVRQDPPALKKEKAGVQIDLSAIAKGFAVDQIALALKGTHIHQYMVEVGGEVRTEGDSPQGRPWRIGIEKPADSGRQVLVVAALEDGALATSGDYRNFRIIDGQRYSHTIDPRTCRPVKFGLASSSIVQLGQQVDGCMTADALATALMVIGSAEKVDFEAVKKRCLSICEANKITGFFVFRDHLASPREPVQWTTFATPDFPLAADDDGLIVNETETPVSIWPSLLGAIIVFGLAILGMAVGTIFGNKPIQGSCGGLSSQAGEEGEAACSLCQNPVEDCPELDDPLKTPN